MNQLEGDCTGKEYKDGALLIAGIDVRHKLLQQVVVDAVLVQPREVPARRHAEVRVHVLVVVRIQHARVGCIVPPTSLQSGAKSGSFVDCNQGVASKPGNKHSSQLHAI